MIRATLLITLTVVIFLCCNSSDNKTMSSQTSTDNETKQDSTSGYASVNGLKMYYEIHGDGTPLVLIHGGGSTIQTTFGQVIHDFAKNA